MKRVCTYNFFRSLRSTTLLAASTAVLVASAAAMLSACSKDNTELMPDKADGIIRLSAAVTASGQVEDQPNGQNPAASQNQPATQGQTRAPHKDETGSKAVLADIHFLRKDATTLPTDFSGTIALSADRDATGAITFTNGANVPVYDKTADKNAYFMAYWPTSKTNATTVAVTSGVKVAWGIDGTTDVLVSTPYDAGKYSAPKVGTMTFQHVLAQLEVIVKAAPTTTTSLEAVQAMWGKINYILIENAPALVTYTFADNKVTYSDPMRRLLYQTDYKTAYINLPIPSSANTATTAAGMHSPVKGEPIRLLLQTEKFPDGIEVPVQLKDTQGANCDFEAGKRYVVTLTLGADDKQVDVSSTVAEWNTGRTGQGSSTWAPPAVGDFYHNDGTWSTTRDASKSMGVIYWIDPEDPAHFKVVAETDATQSGAPDAQRRSRGFWSKNNDQVGLFYPGILANYDPGLNTPEAELVSASGRQSGIANRAWLGQWLANPATNTAGRTIDDFPAFKSCDELGPGWYLPAVNELQQLYCAYFGISQQLWLTGTPSSAAQGYPAWWDNKLGQSLPATDDDGMPYYYWTSSVDNIDKEAYAWTVRFDGYGDTSRYGKTKEPALVRCIKEINPVGQAAAPKVEDYYYSDGSWSRALIPGKTPEGVIYWVDAANPEHFKVVDMAGPPANWEGNGNTAGKLPWSKEEKIKVDVSYGDGKANTLKIMQLPKADEYLSAKWCYTRNEGLLGTAASAVTLNTPGYDWYLPAAYELQHLICAYWGLAPFTWTSTPGVTVLSGYPEAWNARFAEPFLAEYYSSSTEGGNTGLSSVLHFSDGNFANGIKTALIPLRCVREVGAPAAPVAPPKVEDYFYSDGTYSRELDPHKSLDGVIFWVDEYNSKHIKVVGLTVPPANWDGLTNSAEKLPWSTESVVTGISNVSVGKFNTLKLMQLASADKYKAAKWCYLRNSGASLPASSSATTDDANYKWYLPAKDELQHLCCAIKGVDPTTWAANGEQPNSAAGYPEAWHARLVGVGADFRPTNTSYYVSSSETSQADFTIIDVVGGGITTQPKTTNSYKVRCIREVTL